MDESAEGKQLVINANYELFAGGVVVLTLVNWVVLAWLRTTPEQAQVVWIVNTGLCVFLLLDFAFRLWRHPHRWSWLGPRGGWMILLGSLPIPFAGVLRLIRLWLATRLLRRSDFKLMEKVVVQRRAQGTLLSAILAAIVVLEIGALLMLDAESASTQANIKTGIDSLWWGVVTLATVGYGDKFPVTTAGRVVGVIVIVVGVGLFSALTSFLAHVFLRPRSVDNQPQPSNAAEIQDLNRLTTLLRTYDVQRLLADTQRPPDEVLAELRRKVQEINVRGSET